LIEFFFRLERAYGGQLALISKLVLMNTQRVAGSHNTKLVNRERLQGCSNTTWQSERLVAAAAGGHRGWRKWQMAVEKSR
jgi:hypothetical protein